MAPTEFHRTWAGICPKSDLQQLGIPSAALLASSCIGLTGQGLPRCISSSPMSRKLAKTQAAEHC